MKFLFLNLIFLAVNGPFRCFRSIQLGLYEITRLSIFLILNRIFLADKSVNNESRGFPTGDFMKSI